MFKTPLLLLRESTRKSTNAIRAVMLAEDFVSADSAADALKLRASAAPATKATKLEGRLFVASSEGEWTVVAEHDEALSLELASAIAGESGANGYFVQPGRGSNVQLYEVVDGVRADDPAELKHAEAEAKLKGAGIHPRLLSFVAREHMAAEDWKEGKHSDLVCGFHANDRAVQKKTEAERALAEPAAAKHAESMPFDAFLEKAVGNPRTRAIAKAQVEEQLKRDGFSGTLEVHDPQPEGHYCERFDAESFSFTSNGPYVWFDWHCDEACEPVLEAERQFPDCSLRFELETSEQL